MKKMLTNPIVWCACVMLMGMAMMLHAHAMATNEPVEQEPTVVYVEVQKEQMFDTSIIEAQWCGGFTEGTVRMVGAWWYADGVVEDEQGQLWGIDQQIDEQDFLLLWIADNNTPDKTTDDIIIKVWREAY